MKDQLKEGDIVLVKADHANLVTTDYYDYSLWAQTRMTITSFKHGMVTALAIDERPDRAWILRGRLATDRGDPQEVEMSWPIDHLQLAD